MFKKICLKCVKEQKIFENTVVFEMLKKDFENVSNNEDLSKQTKI